jgi:hypothetical protein
VRRLGVIGTFVWDIIHGREPGDRTVEEWGGITYALGALDAALPPDWAIVPVMKVGRDLAGRARDFLATLRRLAPDAALIEVEQPNNRVELRYTSAERRSEVLHGGVPGWSWLGLKPLLGDLDALYINLISGFELDLETACLIRQHFRGPIYCDLHSLVLAVQASGLRTLRPMAPEDAAAWCRCTDLLQVNADEMAMMAPDPMALAATALANGVRALFVTLGARGAVYVAAGDFHTLADLSTPRVLGVEAAPVRTALIPAAAVKSRARIDPTGCGDVWGATLFAHLLAGDNLVSAMRTATERAARNAEHLGASGLAHYLRGELSPT